MLIRRVVKLFALVLGLFALKSFCFSQTDGFALMRVQSKLCFHPDWEVGNQNFEQIRSLFDQPFTYLGCGAQAYAFASADGQFVVKFFRHHHMKKKEKLEKTFSSYKLAMEKLKEETALIYVHLNKTGNLKKTMTFFDKIGIKYEVPLDQMEFVVQKRAEPTYETLERWIANGQETEAKRALSNLVTLLKSRCLKQIHDKNPKLRTNFGFIGTEAIQIDIGRFSVDKTRCDPNIYVDDLIRITDHLCKWLDEKDPELSKHVKWEINEKAL